jgi:hypothetical protein
MNLGFRRIHAKGLIEVIQSCSVPPQLKLDLGPLNKRASVVPGQGDCSIEQLPRTAVLTSLPRHLAQAPQGPDGVRVTIQVLGILAFRFLKPVDGNEKIRQSDSRLIVVRIQPEHLLVIRDQLIPRGFGQAAPCVGPPVVGPGVRWSVTDPALDHFDGSRNTKGLELAARQCLVQLDIPA